MTARALDCSVFGPMLKVVGRLRGSYPYVLHRRGPSSALDVFALHPASTGTAGLEIARCARVLDVSDVPGKTKGCPHLRMHAFRVVHRDCNVSGYYVMKMVMIIIIVTLLQSLCP